MKSLDLDEIVLSLTGPIHATGQHEVDQVHFDNMRTLTELVDRLLGSISYEVRFAEREQASMKAIGIHAKKFLQEIKDTDID